jgi:hypothetical protein
MLGNDRTFPPYEIVMIPRTTGEFPSAPDDSSHPRESYGVPYRSGPAHLDLAQEIGVTQTKEITTMQKLLRSL